MNRKFDIVHMLKYVILIVGTCTVLFPLYVVFVNAFKKEDEGSNPFSLPASFLNFENFANVIDRADIMHAFFEYISNYYYRIAWQYYTRYDGGLCCRSNSI